MRATLIVIAVVALVAIGTTEAVISNDQLLQLPGRARPALSTGGAVLTIIGIALSAAVYAALGALLARDGPRETAALTNAMPARAARGPIHPGVPHAPTCRGPQLRRRRA